MIGTDVTGTTAFDPTGTYPLGNTNDGVSISSSAQGNTIGGTAAGTRNIISGNLSDGIEISGSGTSANLVEGNEIGTNAAGNAAILAAAFVNAYGSDGVAIDSSTPTTRSVVQPPAQAT